MRIGDIVEVERGGDVIPKITRVVEEEEVQRFAACDYVSQALSPLQD